MTEESHEQRRTRKLREVLPLYAFIELTVDSLDEQTRCSVPLSAANTNHVGIMHAGVLFALAEATGGVAISRHRELARQAVIAKHVAITYRRPATAQVSGAATLDDAAAAEVGSGIAADPKHSFEIPVRLFDDADRTIAEAVCTFVLRPAA